MTGQSAMQTSPVRQEWPRDYMQYFVEFPFRIVYYPYGLPLEISTNSMDVIRAAQESWGPFPEIHSAQAVHLRIGVAQTGRPELPPQPTHKAQRGLVTIIADLENFAVCDIPGRFAFGWVTPATIGDPEFFRYHFLNPMAGLLQTSIHFAVVHAACIAYEGHGVLLCGHSGAGKSTLAFACAQRGWTLISDDAGQLMRKNPRRVVIGNPMHIRLREDASNLFPKLREYAVVLRQNGEFGFEIPTAKLPELSTAFKCEVDHIVFLDRHSTGPALLTSFPKDEAQRRLEDILEYTFACEPSCHSLGQTEMALASPEAREEQKAKICELLTADVYELRYSNFHQAIDCLESMVGNGRQREPL
jgi:HPr serine kinase-like protein